VSALALVILGLMQSAGLLGDEPRAAQLAEVFQSAAVEEGTPVHVLVALGKGESHFDSWAVSDVGAQGMMQLHPRWWGKEWKLECAEAGADRLTDEACEALNVRIAARVLRYYKRRCGSWLLAVGAYRSGKCIAGPKSQATMRLARRIKARLGGSTWSG